MAEQLNVVKTLQSFVAPRECSDFWWCHYVPSPDWTKDRCVELENELRLFLNSTMDGVRLQKALKCAQLILLRSDLDDADHFITGLIRREVSGNIKYEKQRDHAAHTLYNYLLGWYFYCKSPLIRKAITDHVEQRRVQPFPANAQMTGRALGLVGFDFLWPYASLLHDIGYLFEGGIDALSTDIQNEQVSIGADIAQVYFHDKFWKSCGIHYLPDIERLKKMGHVEVPDFSQKSLASIGETLRRLGDLRRLREAAMRDGAERHVLSEKPDFLCDTNNVPEDAFYLWERNYAYYGNTALVGRMKTVRERFEFLMDKGLPGKGMRVLDHGICSGLLLLLYSTFYFRVHFGLEDNPPNDSESHDFRVWNLFRRRPGPHGGYSPFLWWSGIVWATAAVALHNVQQSTDIDVEPLRLEEDPLAYLGILVDALQEWDRYTVSRCPAIAGELPLQGVEVKMGKGKDGKISINYGECQKKRVQEICTTLSRALEGWQQIVEISAQ